MQRTCGWCSTTFGAKPAGPGRTGRPRKWCSDACRIAAWTDVHGKQLKEARRNRTAECAWCLAEFPKFGKMTFCSVKCRNDFKRNKPRPITVRSCISCPAQFIVKSPGQRRCDRCHVPEPDRLRAKSARRRGDIAAGELIRINDIGDRDGWVCQLCTAPVDPALEYPHPMCKSLDHIVPLSVGGRHQWDNSQLAHLVCNMKKGAKSAAC